MQDEMSSHLIDRIKAWIWGPALRGFSNLHASLTGRYHWRLQVVLPM